MSSLTLTEIHTPTESPRFMLRATEVASRESPAVSPAPACAPTFTQEITSSPQMEIEQPEPSPSDPTITSPAPNVNFNEMEKFCVSLAKLARTSYTTRKSKNVIWADYTRVRSKIAKFFQRTDGFDFLADGTYPLCLEMKCLATALEMNVCCASTQEFAPVSWPTVEIEVEEERMMKTATHKEVDQLIWGKGRLEVRVREIVNQANEKSRKASERNNARKRDSGYSTGSM